MIARGGGILGDRWRASCKPNQELRGGRGGKHAAGGSCRGLRPHLEDTVTQGSLPVPTSTVNALLCSMVFWQGMSQRRQVPESQRGTGAEAHAGVRGWVGAVGGF